jgi:ATP-dependent DNA ligase
VKFDNYRYIYPPRPKNAISPIELNFWDNNSLIVQPKFNGSNTTIYTDGKKIITMNRHGQKLTNFKIRDNEILNLHKSGLGKWTVVNGEYMNKGRVDEKKINFNDKFIIFDILVFDSEYLVGETFANRIELVNNTFPSHKIDSQTYSLFSENIGIVKSYESGFSNLFENLSKIDMIEGLVMKRKTAKLEIGNTETNNTKSQLKCRKPTKNYKY